MKDKYDSKNKYDSAYSLLLIVLCPMLIIILSFCYAALKQWKKGIINMLVKYKVDYIIPFEDFNYYKLQDQILKNVNEKYPTDNFTLESIELDGFTYYDVNKGDLFTGEAVVKMTQTIPYGQEPQGNCFEIKYLR